MSDVGCAGILVEDTFCGPMSQCPPEGQLVAVDAMPTKAGGCAANVAIDLAKQGVSVEIIGCVGRDGAGAVLKDALEARGVGCRQLIFAEGMATSKTVILLVEGQDRRYVHFFGANSSFTIKQIPRDWVAGLKVFYLGGLCVMPGLKLTELSDLLQFCRSKGVVTVVDVVIPQRFSSAAELCALLPHIDYFLPNDDEARALTGAKDPSAQMRTLLARGANTVIITQGHQGVMAACGEECWRAGTYSASVMDPSGAGDAFASGVITGILRGWKVPEMLRYGSALGASATRAIGTTDGVFTFKEAEAFVKINPLEIHAGKV
ncbi:MAG TPA: carbohydrate kinase family protein [Verrucomicrobiae bacterium]|nr:carbohydrate kinase family protein [Verrucomicrobiae bacterium]